MKRGGLVSRIELLGALLLISIHSCAVYHQKPINEAAVQQSLEPPDPEVIRVQAREIKHPILNQSISVKETAYLRKRQRCWLCWQTLSLRAVRDRRGVAAAQLLQAGILPNPGLVLQP